MASVRGTVEAGRDPVPPGDRTTERTVLDLLNELSARVEALSSRSVALDLRQSWWDQIDNPFRGPGAAGTDGLGEIMLKVGSSEWQLQPNMRALHPLPTTQPSFNVCLRSTCMADGIELMIKCNEVIVWQRKLFYREGPR